MFEKKTATRQIILPKIFYLLRRVPGCHERVADCQRQSKFTWWSSWISL